MVEYKWLSAKGYMSIGTRDLINILDTRGSWYCQNICIWHDGTVRPLKGHNGNCKWTYDGQIFAQPKKAK